MGDATIRAVPKLSQLSYVHGGPTERARFVDGLFRGLKDYGFIILKDHIVDQALVDQAYEAVDQYFKLPEKIKLSYVCKEGGGQRGHTAFGMEHAKDSRYPDLKEFWHVGRQLHPGHRLKKYYPDNIWPKEIPEFQEILSELYSALDETSRVLLDALGEALEVPPNYFRDLINNGNSILRLIHYPPIPEGTPQTHVRAAAHEDINLITILVGATSSGLELLDRDGKWLPVETERGTLIVDSGDMLSRICNEVIPSTTHRVVNPDDSNSTRYSMPFFVHPHPEANLSCIPSCVGAGKKWPDINSHEFLMQRLREIGLM